MRPNPDLGVPRAVDVLRSDLDPEAAVVGLDEHPWGVLPRTPCHGRRHNGAAQHTRATLSCGRPFFFPALWGAPERRHGPPAPFPLWDARGARTRARGNGTPASLD